MGLVNGAIMMREYPEAQPKLHALIEDLRERHQEDAQTWLHRIRSAFTTPQVRGGMSDWGSEHDSMFIESMWASFDTDDALTKLGEYGPSRMVWNPFGLQFFTTATEGAQRRFRGVVTLATTEDTYVGYDKDFLMILVYHQVDEPQKV